MTLTLDFQGQVVKYWYFRNCRANWCEIKRKLIDWLLSQQCVTLTFDHTYGLDHGFSRSNFEIAISQKWESQLTSYKRDVSQSLMDMTAFLWPRLCVRIYQVVTEMTSNVCVPTLFPVLVTSPSPLLQISLDISSIRIAYFMTDNMPPCFMLSLILISLVGPYLVCMLAVSWEFSFFTMVRFFRPLHSCWVHTILHPATPCRMLFWHLERLRMLFFRRLGFPG